MSDATTRIRNLSIALEALYRIGDYGPTTTTDVYILLDHEIKKLKEKKGIPTARPAKPPHPFTPFDP